jgi:hypothetical protein
LIACPSCTRRAFTRRDLLDSTVDGTAQCRFCGKLARLDIFSRWIMSCVIALVLSTALLYGGVFYSGHLFLISIVVIGGAWSGLSMIAFPYLKLEPTSGGPPIGRRHSLLIVAVLLIGATIVDGLMSSRFEPEPASASASSSASRPQRRRRGARKPA